MKRPPRNMQRESYYSGEWKESKTKIQLSGKTTAAATTTSEK